MPTHLDIDYIELTSGNMPASQAFFQKAFGWSFLDYGPDYTAFRAGIDGGVAEGRGTFRPPLVIVYADDLDAAEASIVGAGGVVTVSQFDFPGGRRFHFREPGGNEMAVWSAPKE